MKYMYLFLLPLLFIASCKKDDPANTDDNGNPQNNEPDNRSGLERLTNKDAENYCVMVVGNDTIVWQTTANDTVQYSGGKGRDFPFLYYDFVASQFVNANAHSKLKLFKIELDRGTDNTNAVHDCNMTDTLILKGHISSDTTIGGKRYRMFVSLTDSANTWSITRNNMDHFDIISVTDLPNNTTGCKKVRIKGSMNNISTYNTICGPVPVFTIKESVFQIDFKWPG